ncbi:hypothetical protein E2C01_020967 [Portunus trituberculatus]|uniref:Uncharacterized protein n=1 Tax=Portunus trituberculatus TaxID=210409 RepID=A0A5B7E3F5_PORTR|nr:hypothetical protein [Portunus trituberculatus]
MPNTNEDFLCFSIPLVSVGHLVCMTTTPRTKRKSIYLPVFHAMRAEGRSSSNGRRSRSGGGSYGGGGSVVEGHIMVTVGVQSMAPSWDGLTVPDTRTSVCPYDPSGLNSLAPHLSPPAAGTR